MRGCRRAYDESVFASPTFAKCDASFTLSINAAAASFPPFTPNVKTAPKVPWRKHFLHSCDRDGIQEMGGTPIQLFHAQITIWLVRLHCWNAHGLADSKFQAPSKAGMNRMDLDKHPYHAGGNNACAENESHVYFERPVWSKHSIEIHSMISWTRFIQ